MVSSKRKILINCLLYSVLAFYILLLICILFRQRHGARAANLIPLRGIISFLTGCDLVSGTTDSGFLRGLALSNLLGNIVIFVPMGVYANLLSKKKAVWRSVLLVVIISMAAEVIQYAFMLGIGDVDDVILNGIGGLMGVLLYQGLYRLCKADDWKARCITAAAAPIAGALSFLVLIGMN